mmetsp:Transcript_45942/g.106096  ORF Transcript_45942/g.106096 Transcript_45942/m.106096 type:complete len:135 (-) Transcript_45942:55-459(-)
MGSGVASFLRQAAVIAGSYLLFGAFVGLVWWAAWRLSLSRVPILRECFGSDSGAPGRAGGEDSAAPRPVGAATDSASESAATRPTGAAAGASNSAVPRRAGHANGASSISDNSAPRSRRSAAGEGAAQARRLPP